MTAWARGRQRFALLVRIGALAWLVAHFALTIAYVVPINPVTVGLQPLLEATIGRYFEQNWGMFAPNPRSADSILLARLLTPAEVAEVPARGLPTDGWYDLSTPLWDGAHRNPFSAYHRLTRPQARAVMAYLNGGPDLTLWRESCARGDPAACAYYEERLAVARQEAGRLLARLGSAFSRDVATPASGVSHVALRVREVQPIPWSERHTGQRGIQDAELGVYPIDWSVAPAGAYRLGPPA